MSLKHNFTQLNSCNYETSNKNIYIIYRGKTDMSTQYKTIFERLNEILE